MSEKIYDWDGRKPGYNDVSVETNKMISALIKSAKEKDCTIKHIKVEVTAEVAKKINGVEDIPEAEVEQEVKEETVAQEESE